GGLEASGGEGTHLEVEAAAEPVLFSDQGVGGYYPVVEDDLEAVHAAVADGGYGPGLDCSPLRLGEVEGVSGEAGFLNDEQREAAVAGGGVVVGAGQDHEQIGSAGERGPRLGSPQ